MRLWRREANRDVGAAAVTEGISLAPRRRHREGSAADKPAQKHRQQPIHGRLPQSTLTERELVASFRPTGVTGVFAACRH